MIGLKMATAAPDLRQSLRLSLEETSSRQVHRATEAEKDAIRRRGYSSAPLYDFRPSGNMTLKIENIWQAGVQSSWRDISARRIEDRLNEVMAENLGKGFEQRRFARRIGTDNRGDLGADRNLEGIRAEAAESGESNAFKTQGTSFR